MAQVKCAVCKKEGDSRKMFYCSRCNLWVHFECGGGSTGLLGFLYQDPECPSCGMRLRK